MGGGCWDRTRGRRLPLPQEKRGRSLKELTPLLKPGPGGRALSLEGNPSFQGPWRLSPSSDRVGVGVGEPRLILGSILGKRYQPRGAISAKGLLVASVAREKRQARKRSFHRGLPSRGHRALQGKGGLGPQGVGSWSPLGVEGQTAPSAQALAMAQAALGVLPPSPRWWRRALTGQG